MPEPYLPGFRKLIEVLVPASELSVPREFPSTKEVFYAKAPPNGWMTIFTVVRAEPGFANGGTPDEVWPGQEAEIQNRLVAASVLPSGHVVWVLAGDRPLSDDESAVFEDTRRLIASNIPDAVVAQLGSMGNPRAFGFGLTEGAPYFIDFAVDGRMGERFVSVARPG
jgi:hypothetical protein